MNIVKLYRGTNKQEGAKLLNNQFNDLSWWSDDYQTLAHYYEGCAIEMEIELDESVMQEYIHDKCEVDNCISYTYGFAEMSCPTGAIWYAFGAEYLKHHILNITEIYPDLSNYK